MRLTPESPLPWRCEKDPEHFGYRIVDKDGQDLGIDFTHRNAQYIVQCCNTHPELVKTLKEAQEMIGKLMGKYAYLHGTAELWERCENLLQELGER